jgi:hypothetical protein
MSALVLLCARVCCVCVFVCVSTFVIVPVRECSRALMCSLLCERACFLLCLCACAYVSVRVHACKRA